MEARLATTNLSPFPIFFLYGFSGSFAFSFFQLFYVYLYFVFLSYMRYGLYFPMVFELLEALRDNKNRSPNRSLFSLPKFQFFCFATLLLFSIELIKLAFSLA